jgi:hypothetical protein
VVSVAEIIQRRSGAVILVDDSDLALVVAAGPWRIYRDGRTAYARRVVRRGNPPKKADQRLHTFLTGWPLVDHINGNGLDNRRANLRPATQQQNQANCHTIKSSSGYKGVTFHRATGRWQAAVGYNNRKVYLGLFDTPEQAAHTYDAAARRLFGEFARPNFAVDGTDLRPVADRDHQRWTVNRGLVTQGTRAAEQPEGSAR